jgi:hypothetical protein
MDDLLLRKLLREKLFFSIIEDKHQDIVQRNLENYFSSFTRRLDHSLTSYYSPTDRKRKLFEILKIFRVVSWIRKNNSTSIRLCSSDFYNHVDSNGCYNARFVRDEIICSFHYTDEEEKKTGDGYSYLESNNHDLDSCYQCDEIFISEDMRFSDHSDDYYCEGCYDDNHEYCETCDTSYHHDEERNCDDCQDEDGSRSSILAEYNERNILYYLSDTKREKATSKSIYYGIELECEMREGQELRETVEKMKECFDQENILFKRDGSLDYGFEIVSTNATFNYHKNLFWKSFFENDYTNEVRGYYAKNCGMHIHFSKKSFSDLEIRKLNTFYHNIDNRSFLHHIAGRSTNDYAKFYDDIDLKTDIVVPNDSYYKYRCINLVNTNTLEIRIFQSNLKQNSFFRNLEFVDSVNHFIKQTSLKKLDFKDYLAWLIKDTKKSYFNLYEFLQKNFYFEATMSSNIKGFKNLLAIIESEKKRKCA